MSLLRRTPLSNRTIERQITVAHGEMLRARALGSDIRELWFEDQMNKGLDILIDRGYGRRAAEA